MWCSPHVVNANNGVHYPCTSALPLLHTVHYPLNVTLCLFLLTQLGYFATEVSKTTLCYWIPQVDALIY